MAMNMSYCRFENTTIAFEECMEALEEKNIDELSESEQFYARKLIELAEDFVRDYSQDYMLEQI